MYGAGAVGLGLIVLCTDPLTPCIGCAGGGVFRLVRRSLGPSYFLYIGILGFCKQGIH